MPKLVIATHRRLDGARSGSKTYLLRMLDLAADAGFELQILCLPRWTFSSRPWARTDQAFSDCAEVVWPGTFKAAGRYWTAAPSVWARFATRLGQEGLKRAKIGPAGWHAPWSNLGATPSARELDQAARAVLALDPDAVMVEYSSLAPLLARLPAVIGKAVLVHDSFAARAARFRARGEPSDYPNPPSFEEEASRMAAADVIYHASVSELDRFSPLLPKADHVWFRPTAPVRRNAVTTRPPAHLFYLGADQKGSRDAITHFLAEIWPMIRADRPDARLDIIGRVGANIPLELVTDGVELVGEVEDLGELAGPDRIGLAPTRLASGISIKIGEYLGIGAPVIAYPTAVEGYGNALKGVVATPETPAAFACEAVRLLSDADLRAERSAAGLAAAETVLDNDEVSASLARLAAGGR